MSERKPKRCNNCLLAHTGTHPFICPKCREALKDAGPVMKDDPPTPRTPWWDKRGVAHG